MTKLYQTKATLRIMGDDLIPSEITNLLECKPSKQMIKGEPFSYSKEGKPRIAVTGMWRLIADKQLPGNLDLQIEEIFNLLPTDLKIWEQLSKQYKVQLFCGLFMDSENEGIKLSAKSLLILGERNIEIDFDMYS